MTRSTSATNDIGAVDREPSQPSGSVSPGAGQPWYRWFLTSWAGQATIGAATLGVMLHLRYGYYAGHRDHLVLSPLGMQWAHPDWFRGDWAMAHAVQPHWMFDVLTWLGSATDTLGAVYLLYWLLGLAVFGFGSAMVARAWAPRFTVLAIIAITVASAVTPIYFLGSGPILFATALPGVLGGALLFVSVGALLTERNKLAAGASVAAALVHVQLGTVSAVLLLLVAAWFYFRHRRFDRLLLAGAAVSFAIVAVNLRVRPVVGHFSDFVDACQTLVPYHCEASTWTRSDIRGGVALVLLATLTVWYVPKGKRHLWAIVVALPAFGLLVGFAADRFNVPGLGVSAQGVNVYRLAQMLLPLAVWGLFTPVFAKLSSTMRWATLAVVLFLGHSALGMANWGVEQHTGGNGAPWMLVLGGTLVLGVAALTVPDLVRAPERLVRVAVVGSTACVLLSAAYAGTLTWKTFDPRLFPQGDLAAWGEQVEREVPSGAVVLGPPADITLRMVIKRAIVADCKYGPYGGDPWREYKNRVNALGGFEQCFGAKGYGGLSGAAIADAARTYGAEYVVIAADEPERIRPLTDSGWEVRLQPVNRSGYVLLKAPWV